MTADKEAGSGWINTGSRPSIVFIFPPSLPLQAVSIPQSVAMEDSLLPNIPFSSSPDGYIYSLQGRRYYVRPDENAPPFDGGPESTFVTVFHISHEGPFTITIDWLAAIISECQAKDDVFHVSFLQGIILVGLDDALITMADGVHDYMQKVGIEWIQSIPEGDEDIHPGPYFLTNGLLQEVWRLYPDTNGAFLEAVEPGQTSPFLHLSLTHAGTSDIAVTSRLRSSQSTLPLAGLRVAVKDNIHLQGLKTSLGNRAYHKLSAPQQTTAGCIQQLINLGATIVGKTKLNSFGVWEEPIHNVDYQAPWNPRGDGYQTPRGSDSGSAVAVVAYDWLDIAVGTDTGGSILRPALWNGCFAIRPTWGALSTHGLVARIGKLDTPGFLGRDLGMFRDVITAWYGDELPTFNPKPFKKIIWPTDYWNTVHPDQRTVAEKFILDMEAALGIWHETISIQSRWETPRPGFGTLDNYMNDAMRHIWYDDYHEHDDFRGEYQRRFQKAPYISPAVRENWTRNKSITEVERNRAAAKLDDYRIWFQDAILAPTSGNCLLVLPIENMSPSYRDEGPQHKQGGPSVNSLMLASVLGAPELVVPISQILYTSKVTEKEEHLPFAIGLVGPPGTDLHLVTAALTTLRAINKPIVLSTGASAFTGKN
ncbi:amidase signature enzyme [Aspergillus ibericus CBS 121593]|uniref:Amidase signature enzyme n=1 Tax=Aspergillus ibericus CBS 121593 TaxID=1448316 RepID=A0A395GXY5_9EURO|nr:amidase signature enzyme [Aspergillus ibericus CBS 121593]RAL00203.1 amidase signature enzyme [Aspergillus ibericus CBS 121593]